MNPRVVNADSQAPASARSATRYSPHTRTALVLTGTGTAGAYHAGVLRALHEAGVKIDLVAGRGIGAVGAAFAAVDGGAQLWDPAGLWNAAGATRLFRWRLALRVAAWMLGVALGAVVLPLGVVVLAALVYPLAYLLGVVGLVGGEWLTMRFGQLVEWVFAPALLPVWLPRFVVASLARKGEGGALGIVSQVHLGAGCQEKLRCCRMASKRRNQQRALPAGLLVVDPALVSQQLGDLFNKSIPGCRHNARHRLAVALLLLYFTGCDHKRPSQR